MAQAGRDNNFVPTLLGVSNVDGTTPVAVYADPTTHRLLVDLPSGSGSVTSVSVVTANGFAGTVATATTTPAITLTTSVTGILKGNGTAISAASAGTDYADASFKTIAVSGQSDVVADSAADTLTLAAGAGVTITTVAGTDTITIAASSAGDVTKVGTPVNNQMAVWTGDGTLEGTSDFTYDGTNLNLITGKNLQIAGATVLADAAGTTTLSNIDAVDATTEATIEAAIDTLNNLTLTGTPIVYSTDVGATGPILELYHDSASPAASDTVGQIAFYGEDSAGNKQQYAGISARITDTTSTSEDGDLYLSTTTAGTYNTTLILKGTGLIPNVNDAVSLGTSTTQFSDLFLAEGGVINWDNGDMTITQAGNLMTIAGGNVLFDSAPSPTSTDGAPLGGAGGQWSDLYLAEGGVINWDNGDVTLTQTGNVLAVSGGDLQVATAGVGTNADSVPTLSSTNTLTNKRVTPRAGTTTSSATPTINTDNYDYYSLTAQTVDITSFTTNLSGTPTDGQKLWISITGTAARAITWGASFEASTIALPTTTVTTNRLDVGFVWNAATSKWRCVASA